MKPVTVSTATESARNAWTTWKELPVRLEAYFAPDPVWPEDDTELT